ncbi:ThuA domain-containing protein [Halalkalibaculum sp. DA3122]|uniref:ThuA domain-containing protein n=1 Tax=Halalkalibaculum sp. DA3122 TaxID=3373607 RepID=UPI0037544208
MASKEYSEPSSVLIVGGGSAHDFDRWFNLEDSKTISETGALVRYTDQPENISAVLSQIDVLYLSNNQPMPATGEFRNSIFDFVESGNGLLLVHAATWYNWEDWPEYNRELVGGGTRSHEPFGEFQVEVTDTGHPIMESVPSTFSIIDELYHFEPDESGKEIHILAKGIVPDSGEEYPIAWTLIHGKGRIVGLTLGHDGKAHYHHAYRTILKNSIEWLNDEHSID